MVTTQFTTELTQLALADEIPSDEQCHRILYDTSLDLMDIIHAAYQVRRTYWGKDVQVHILNNAQNGNCPEDCAYCTQARTSEADIEDYPIKSDDEILAEARLAAEGGAFRYCMVFAGRGPNNKRTDTLTRLVSKIKAEHPQLEICVSAGLLDDEKAARLKDAGLDRLNHNLNTSRRNYEKICTTHTYDDRVNTLESAKRAGLEVCSGMIVGMGETPDELIDIAKTLRSMDSKSIPVNFLLPFEGNLLERPVDVELSPEYCLRVLSLFRFINPRAEVRCGAGREHHLKALEPFCLYPANSIFLQGYLNGKGSERRRTLEMIHDARFNIVSDEPLEELIARDAADAAKDLSPLTVNGKLTTAKKSLEELRPAMVH